MKLIHWGASKYNKELFKPIKNSYLSDKPSGGLWTSPVNSIHSWKQWTEANGHKDSDLFFELDLKNTTRILTIDIESDFNKLMFVPNEHNAPEVDFECLMLNYDAIWLTYTGELNSRAMNFNSTLHGWDCETVLILNKECIIII